LEVPRLAEARLGDAAGAERRALRELERVLVVQREASVTAPKADAPRLVSTIVCAFSGELPTAWLAVFHRFEKRLARAGFRVRVRLHALEDLPERYEILIVPPDLEERARGLETAAQVIATTRADAPAAADALVRELERGSRVYAERADPNAPVLRTHRGMEEL
jgi:hypothetical protein